MFEELDQKNQNSPSGLNNKLVQDDQSLNLKKLDQIDLGSDLKDSNSDSFSSSYQEKLKNNKMAEDIFAETDQADQNSSLTDKNEKDKEGLAPIKPLQNYKELVKEGEEVRTEKFKTRYFLIGLVVLVIVLGVGAYFVYQTFFTGERKTGEVILDTDSGEIELESKEPEEIPEKVITETGVSVNVSKVPEDLDSDGLTNQEEENLGTDPENSDTDNDSLSDREEIRIYHTDPLNMDTDGDGYGDGEEISNGYNPLGSGKLFDFSLITGESDNFNEEIKLWEVVDISTPSWLEHQSKNYNLNFEYPPDWELDDLGSRLVLYPPNSLSVKVIEIEIRENKLELDLIDWINTQADYPDFQQDQIKINNQDALIVSSADPEWESKNDIFLAVGDLVYNFKLYSEDESYLSIFETIIITADFK